jgi:hemoglobin
MEKPHRSAIRNSFGDNAKPDSYSRRSSSSISNVGFSLSGDTPDAEKHRHLAGVDRAGADSISLKKIVDMFYEKVVADPKIGKFFDGIDLGKLKRHQVRFMALAFGGKELVFEEDPNLDLRKVHYRLIRDKGLSLSDWECFVGLFDETMEQLERDIPPETRHAASRSIRATRHYFVPVGQETEYTSAPIIEVPEPLEAEVLPATQQSEVTRV